jgi:hypothetical protein
MRIARLFRPIGAVVIHHPNGTADRPGSRELYFIAGND